MQAGALRVYLAVEVGATHVLLLAGMCGGASLRFQEVRRVPFPRDSVPAPESAEEQGLIEDIGKGLALAARAHGPSLRSVGAEASMDGLPADVDRQRAMAVRVNAWLCGRTADAMESTDAPAGPGKDLGEVHEEVARRTGLRGCRVVDPRCPAWFSCEAGDRPAAIPKGVFGNLLAQMIADGAVRDVAEGMAMARRGP